VPSDGLQHGALGGFVLGSLAALLAMYLITHIADAPGRRFVRFATLITAIVAAGVLRAVASRAWRRALLVLLLVPPAVPVVRDVLRGRDGHDTITAHGGESFLPLRAVPGPAGVEAHERADGALVVPAPLFAWQREQLSRGEATGR
jgi:hypothetical protein